jgi:hypothetical protein
MVFSHTIKTGGQAASRKSHQLDLDKFWIAEKEFRALKKMSIVY